MIKESYDGERGFHFIECFSVDPALEDRSRGGRVGSKRCLELGLKQNPRIVAAERAAEASKARVVQFQADYYPTVALEGDYTRFSGSLNNTSDNTVQATASSTTSTLLPWD